MARIVDARALLRLCDELEKARRDVIQAARVYREACKEEIVDAEPSLCESARRDLKRATARYVDVEEQYEEALDETGA